MREGWIQWNASIGSFTAAVLGLFVGRGLSGDGVSHPNRVHLFAGMFPSEEDMYAYCFTPVTPHGPEQLNLDLPSASVDTQMIDAAYGYQVDARLTEYFGSKERRRIRAKLKPGESIVLVPERAFMGREYQLNTTPRLRHIGYEESLAMAASAMTP